MDNANSPDAAQAPVALSSTSWNPALRHDKEVPATSVRKPTLPPVESSSEEEESEEDEEADEEEDDDEEDEESDDEEDVATAPPAAPVHVAPVAAGTNNTDDDGDFFARHTAPTVSQSAPPPKNQEQRGVNGDGEDVLIRATQRLNINHQAAIPTTRESSDEDESEEESEDESSEDEAGAPQTYEHQGEATALEEAMNESVKVPLVADAAPETDDWGGSDDGFDLGGQPQVAPLETPLAEAVGTNVGDDVIGNTKVGGNTGDGLDWGNTEDADFFGGSALETVESAQPLNESPGAHIVSASDPPAPSNKWDLDLDLDDEFLPDEEDAPMLELSDDDGFLEDEPPAPAAPATNRYAPQGTQNGPTATPGASPYAPQGQFGSAPQSNLQRSITSPTGAYGGYGQNPAYQQQQQPARPAMPSSAQSFADKSKGGYASPYDMPDDIVTNRRRPAPRPSIPAAQPTLPPPRLSSMAPNQGARPVLSSSRSVASLSPPSSGHSMQAQMSGFPSNAPPKPAPPAKTASPDFFAELPVTSKPKPAGRYTPQPSAPASIPGPQGPPQPPFKERTASWSSLRNEVLPETVGVQPHFRQPEQLPMFPSQPSVPARQNSLPIPQNASAPLPARYSPAPPPPGPAANSRYSPAPPSAQGATNSRYSPAPPGAQNGNHTRYVSEPPTGPPRPPSQTYAPRTSSPLTSSSMPQHQDQQTPATDSGMQQLPGHHVSQSADGVPRALFRSPLEGVSETEERTPFTARSETPSRTSSPSSAIGSPRKKGSYTPHHQPPNAFIPLRSISQSPAAGARQPASAYGAMSAFPSFGPQTTSSSSINIIEQRRQPLLNYECIVPDDERAGDELERWRGYPIFTWGIGGTIITSSPKQIPRYGGGMTAPMMKCSPGEVRVQSVKDLFPLSEDFSKFPGPLKAKGKKKDVLTWLGKKIETLEGQSKEPNFETSLDQDDMKRLEDKALLLRLLQTLVDHDGRLDADAAQIAVKKLFSPATENASETDGMYSTAADIVGRSRSNTLNPQAEPVDTRAIGDLQKMLLTGEREKAVWHAVDQRLWGHAMLLSSTLPKDVWKQVVQEFVSKEVKKLGPSNQALAFLYEVFAGNHEDCIDELVPASARAGFQMVSTHGADATQNVQQGLDKWRETVALILNNRSDGDVAALLSLGRLLTQYGRVEAAHTCIIFARSVAHISGVDDAQSDMVLIGIDHKQNPLELGIDMEPILLTEVYEFALSLSAQGGTHILPHLQNYKLAHAYQLAQYGYRADAQAYCDAITATMKATTRPSPYYNAAFISTLDDFIKRLSQSPKDNSSSWISKPSMDRVSTSLLSKFNSFIAGDDEDVATNKPGGAEAGPFARITANGPSLTPSQSSPDLYGAYSGYGAPTQPPAASNSRYAPSNAYAPRTSSEQQQSRYEPSGRPSMESLDSQRAVSDSYMPMTPMTPAMGSYSPQPQLSPPSQRLQAKSQSYSPLRTEQNVPQPSYGSPYLPTRTGGESDTASMFGGSQQPQPSLDEPPPYAGQEHSFDNYAAPSTFEPPTYQPYDPDAKDQAEERPKKSFMDDEDDEMAARDEFLNPKTNSKSEADRKADEAFRKAAEADAKRDKDNAAAKKGGWLTGWFKKDPNAPPAAIKAKLGDESSFFYDPDLGKWVNKKAGASEDSSKPSATPPPPKGGSRSASGGPPNSTAPPPNSGLMRPPTSAPMRSSSMPPAPGSRASTPGLPSDTEGPKPPMLARPSFGAASGPPSRPGTGMSNASSIDDLLGAPQARKGAGAKKKKGGRYVDVLEKS
jgi:hypothetical protein